MAIEDTPLTRVRYGEWLRVRREAAGLTQDVLGERAIMSRTHIAHIEAGRRRPSPSDARRLDEVLDTGGVFEVFLPALDGRAVAEHFQEAAELESLATVIREYAPKLVPGILQTETYAREVLGSGYPAKTDEDRDRLVSTRLERARILENFDSPEVCVLLDEAVLRRPIGSPAVMAEQLTHVVELGERRRIRCHVLPYSVGYHVLLEGLVKLMWFAELPPVAYQEGPGTGTVWENPAVVRHCQAAYEHALGDALPHRDSVALIRSVAREYEHAAH